MTSEEFWKDDPRLFSSYQTAYINDKKREIEERNYSNWLQGMYIYDGLTKSLTSFGYGFLAGKRNPNDSSYPNKPYDLSGKTKLDKKKEKAKENQANLNFWARIKG